MTGKAMSDERDRTRQEDGDSRRWGAASIRRGEAGCERGGEKEGERRAGGRTWTVLRGAGA